VLAPFVVRLALGAVSWSDFVSVVACSDWDSNAPELPTFEMQEMACLSMKSHAVESHKSQRIIRRRLVLFLLAAPFVLALLLFLPAGTLAWARGWVFLLVSFGTEIISRLYLWHVNPELLVARSQFHEGAKRWDALLARFYFPLMLSMFPIAALDDGRFRWSALPWWVSCVGYFLLLVGASIDTWAKAVNRFFELHVRLQTERGHKAIDAGPYAIVRHPGYASRFFIAVGIPLCLGSLWALIPAGFSCFLLILRIRWEDETLQAELAGYKEYMARVRYKLIPGVW
jgi:protein-S-isoprenylcysteine O-methyltransferase Ste14